jgi:hypothetical protein
MANTREKSPRAPNPNSTANAISEVGSMLNTTVQGLVTFMLEMIKPLAQKPSAEAKRLTLLRFNPEVAGADPATWCSTVRLAMRRHPLQGYELFSALSIALEGSAGSWFTQIQPYEDITWPVFEELFTTRYGVGETAASALMMVARESPLEDEAPGVYGMRLNSLLRARWQNLTVTEITNAVTLYLLAVRDLRFERLAFTSDLQTLDQFQTEMRAFSYKKKLTPLPANSSIGPEAKRQRSPEPRIKCYRCGARGHRKTECPKRMKSEQEQNMRNPKESRPATSSKVSCFKCREEGYIAPNCPLLRKGNCGPKSEPRVDSCVVEAPTGWVSRFHFTSILELNVH